MKIILLTLIIIIIGLYLFSNHMKSKYMKVGTKSLLFGVHQIFIHPVFVFIAWTKLFGFPKDPRLWIAFIVHDWGYWEKNNMDGKGEGEEHPLVGANIMHFLFDPAPNKYVMPNGTLITDYCSIIDAFKWYNFTLYHSRFYAKKYNYPISKLCIADKYVFCIQPRWMYLPMARWSGEVYEYMDENKGRSGIAHKDEDAWFDHVRLFMENWVKDEMNKLK